MGEDAPSTESLLGDTIAGYRVVVVDTRDQALHALAAQRDGSQPLALLSPPSCVDYLGPGWLAALIASVREPMPPGTLAIVDCGGSAGRAYAALATAIDGIVFTGHLSAGAALRDIARQRGKLFLAARPTSCPTSNPSISSGDGR